MESNSAKATFEEPKRKWCEFGCSFHYTDREAYKAHALKEHPTEVMWIQAGLGAVMPR